MFVTFSLRRVAVNMHSPKQRCARFDFDKAVDSKPHKRDAPRNRTRINSNHTFKAIPCNREIFQSLSALDYGLASRINRTSTPSAYSDTASRRTLYSKQFRH